jgi:hypothetical protein
MAGCVTTKIFNPVTRRNSTEDNLRMHIYAPFAPRPAWEYIGASRRKPGVGTPLPERVFSVKTTSTWGFQWTKGDQAAAVKAGFFLHRSGYSNRVNVIGVNDFDLTVFNTDDGYQNIRSLERLKFEHPPRGGSSLGEDRQGTDVRLYDRALRFIKQQDQFGYSGAWESDEIAFYSSQLHWYRVYLAKQKVRKTGNVSRYARAIIARVTKTASTTTYARQIRSVRKARNAIRDAT